MSGTFSRSKDLPSPHRCARWVAACRRGVALFRLRGEVQLPLRPRSSGGRGGCPPASRVSLAAAALNFPSPSLLSMCHQACQGSHLPPPPLVCFGRKDASPTALSLRYQGAVQGACPRAAGTAGEGRNIAGGRGLSGPRTCVPGPEERTLPKHELTGGGSPLASGAKALSRDYPEAKLSRPPTPRPPSLLNHTPLQHHPAV